MFLFLFIRINICWQYVFVLTHDTDTIIRSQLRCSLPSPPVMSSDNHYQHSGKEASEAERSEADASGITQYNAAVIPQHNSIGRGK